MCCRLGAHAQLWIRWVLVMLGVTNPHPQKYIPYNLAPALKSPEKAAGSDCRHQPNDTTLGCGVVRDKP